MFENFIPLNWKIFLFIKKSKRKEKNLFRKNKGKVGERAHVDTENRTMKSAQHDFWYYLYFVGYTTGCIIVNNSIFFELTSVGIYVCMCKAYE